MAAVFPALAHTLAQAGYAATRPLRLKTIGLLALAGSADRRGWVAARPVADPFSVRRAICRFDAGPANSGAGRAADFINYALTHFLVARRQQRLNLIFNAVIFVVNLVLCMWLIPRFGPGGAALAIVLSELTLLTLVQPSPLSR